MGRLGWSILYEPELNLHQLEVVIRNQSTGKWELKELFKNDLIQKERIIHHRFLWWKWEERLTDTVIEDNPKTIDQLRQEAVELASSIYTTDPSQNVCVIEYVTRTYGRNVGLPFGYSGTELAGAQSFRDREGIIWENGKWQSFLPQKKYVPAGIMLDY